MALNDLRENDAQLSFQLASGTTGRHLFGPWEIPVRPPGGSGPYKPLDKLLASLIADPNAEGILKIQQATHHSDDATEADRLYQDVAEVELDDEYQALQVVGLGGRFVRIDLNLSTALTADATLAVRAS